MVRLAWQYGWSSAAVHVGKAKKNVLLNLGKWRQISARIDWKSELQKGSDSQQIKIIRNATNVGRPLGSDSFMSKLEKFVGRRLTALPVGRPKKKTEK